MFRAAVFDLDGLLIDSERVLLQLWSRYALELGVALTDADFQRVIGLGSAESSLILQDILGSAELVQELRRRTRAHIEAEDHHGLFPLRPGADELVQALAACELPLAVASSSRIAYVERQLQICRLRPHFQALAGGDEVARAKPDPAVYRLAADRLGVAPEHCLAFEDSIHGVQAARAAGMRVVMVPDLVEADAELGAQLHALLPTLEHALPHLDRWFAVS